MGCASARSEILARVRAQVMTPASGGFLVRTVCALVEQSPHASAHVGRGRENATVKREIVRGFVGLLFGGALVAATGAMVMRVIYTARPSISGRMPGAEQLLWWLSRHLLVIAVVAWIATARCRNDLWPRG